MFLYFYMNLYNREEAQDNLSVNASENGCHQSSKLTKSAQFGTTVLVFAVDTNTTKGRLFKNGHHWIVEIKSIGI